MLEEKKRYTSEELQEFKEILGIKINKAKKELKELTDTINSIGSTSSALSEEDSSNVEQREQLNELASRQYKFIEHLEEALNRIHKGTYGICVVTGKLIEKGRLRSVPHTNHSKEAKDKRKPKPTSSYF